MDELRERVKRGVGFLNRKYGEEGWRGKINKKTLDIANNSDCPVGQLEGGFYSALDRGFFCETPLEKMWHWGKLITVKEHEKKAFTLGFIGRSAEEIEALTKIWKEIL